MPSAFAASGDITDSIVYLSLGDDGSGDLQLQAYGPGGEVLSPTAPVRVPSSNAYEIPAGGQFGLKLFASGYTAWIASKCLRTAWTSSRDSTKALAFTKLGAYDGAI